MAERIGGTKKPPLDASKNLEVVGMYVPLYYAHLLSLERQREMESEAILTSVRRSMSSKEPNVEAFSSSWEALRDAVFKRTGHARFLTKK